MVRQTSYHHKTAKPVTGYWSRVDKIWINALTLMIDEHCPYNTKTTRLLIGRKLSWKRGPFLLGSSWYETRCVLSPPIRELIDWRDYRTDEFHSGITHDPPTELRKESTRSQENHVLWKWSLTDQHEGKRKLKRETGGRRGWRAVQ